MYVHDKSWGIVLVYRIFARIGHTFLHRTQGYEKGVRPIYECRNKRSLTSSAQATNLKRSQIDDQPFRVLADIWKQGVQIEVS